MEALSGTRFLCASRDEFAIRAAGRSKPSWISGKRTSWVIMTSRVSRFGGGYVQRMGSIVSTPFTLGDIARAGKFDLLIFM